MGIFNKGKTAETEKAKKLSPKDILAEQIEKLTSGQVLYFKVPESWGGDFIAIELNPQYPEKPKSKKYLLGVENIVNGQPGGKKTSIGDSDKPIELAKWVLDRQGEPFVAKEAAVGK